MSSAYAKNKRSPAAVSRNYSAAPPGCGFLPLRSWSCRELQALLVRIIAGVSALPHACCTDAFDEEDDDEAEQKEQDQEGTDDKELEKEQLLYWEVSIALISCAPPSELMLHPSPDLEASQPAPAQQNCLVQSFCARASSMAVGSGLANHMQLCMLG